jgi:hypothetical protein
MVRMALMLRLRLDVTLRQDCFVKAMLEANGGDFSGDALSF